MCSGPSVLRVVVSAPGVGAWCHREVRCRVGRTVAEDLRPSLVDAVVEVVQLSTLSICARLDSSTPVGDDLLVLAVAHALGEVSVLGSDRFSHRYPSPSFASAPTRPSRAGWSGVPWDLLRAG